MKKLDMIVLGLLVLGGLNWGLWGLFQFSIVNYVVGNEIFDRIIYFLVGCSGIYVVIRWRSFFKVK
jgi:uncharacterized protein